MNKTIKRIISLIMLVILCLSFVACQEGNIEQLAKNKEEGVWKDAVYTEDAEFGTGAKKIVLEVIAEDKSVSFTINTDKENLEDALVEHKLIDGEKGPYGMYIKKVNGITADYDVDQSYWALSQDGTPSVTGASGVEIKGGEHFEFTHTK